ncbi:RHS repeat-associated core domain-containing protein [Xanthomonas arboricola]|uniref:RHS repeat-associated core domain-containing protein n=1 Tax=Xanthomonas arboricola TaxID=56448 RepID=UPI00209BBD67|nr:RHS repeat-associated core domain-containing protein [Xanthomonas arboricola]
MALLHRFRSLPGGVAPKSDRLTFWHSWTLSCVLIALSACAWAQEAKPKFSVYDTDGKHFGDYTTQVQAEAAIKTIPGPTNVEDIYKYIDTIKQASVSENGEMTITYWTGREKAKDEDWVFQSWGLTDFATEADAVKDLVRQLNERYPQCGLYAKASPEREWAPSIGPYPEYDRGMEYQKRDYVVTTTYSDCDGTLSYSTIITRKRRAECPKPFTAWLISEQACANKDFFATIKVAANQCGTDTGSHSGLVGNPCDVKTGEKFQVESDFNLGWIDLIRYYHSGIAVAAGDFGQNWSHSHGLRLTIQSSTLGLIEGNGYAIPFRKSGQSYDATNGSGERIIPDGETWKLYRRDAIYTFDAKGRLFSRMTDDGAGLLYAYDSDGRLSKITSLQGRSVDLRYADGANKDLIASVSSAGVLLSAYTYDQGRLKSVTFADGGMRVYHYEDLRFSRHLTGITNENGQRFSTYAYDDVGRAVSSQHIGGADGVALAYSSAGTIVTDALGGKSTYAMTNAGGQAPKISAITDGAGTASYTYYDQSVDYRRRLSTMTDRRGIQTKHIYSETTENGVNVSVHTVQEALGHPQQRTITTATATGSNKVLSIQLDGRKTTYTRNARLQPVLLTITSQEGQKRELAYTYCEASDVATSGGGCPILGYLKSIDGPRTDIDDRTTYNYYPIDAAGCETGTGPCPYRKGDLKQTIKARGQIRENLSYDAAGRVLSAVDENGVLTDYSYHPRGWLASTTVHGATSGQNRVTTLEYWPTGLVKRITQPDGSYATFVYDQAQRLTDVTDTLGNTLHYVLDDAGNRLEEQTKDAQGTLKRSLSRIYNQLGQLKTQADAAANPTDYAYDANGNLRLITDAFGRSTLQEHDPLGRLARTLQDVDGIKAETNVGYDTQDRPLQVKDPKRLDTRYTYNGFGDTLKLTSPDTGVTSYTYDSAGNRATQTDARGITSTYGYDALNRVLSISYPTTAFNVSYTYDVTQSVCASGETFTVGRLAKLQDGSGTTQYCYNRFGEVVRKVQTVNGKMLVLRYDYTPGGRLRSMVYPDGTTVDYVRNAHGQTTEVGVTAQGGSRQRLLSGATYYPFGPSAGWTYGNGRTLARMYDQDYRPQSIQDSRTGGLEIGFGFDPVGDLTDLTPAGNPTPELQLTYDALGRLTALKDGSTGTVIDGYSYDGTGNRMSAKVGGATQAYTYPTTNHRLSAVAGVARTYDKMGNTLTIGGKAREYLYDNTGRMTQVKRAGVAVMNYRYNGLGEQVRRYLGTTNTYTLYDEAGHWLGDYDTNGAPKQQAIWLDDLPVGLLANGGQLHYIEPDHLGSPRVVVDAARDVAVWNWSLKGEAFGNTAPNQDPDGDGTAMTFDMRFPGQRFDAASGFNQNYFRDYDAAAGRYGQSDPVGIAADISTYSYVSANPYEMFDLLGLESVGSFNNGGQRLSWEDGVNLRGPDFVKVSFNYGPGTLSFTRGRNGRVYTSKGLAKIYPHSISAGVSASMGWVNECEGRPNDAQLNNLFTGPGLAGFGAYGPLGGAYSYSPGAGSTTEIGVGTGVSITKGRGTGGFGGEKGEVISNDGWGWEW